MDLLCVFSTRKIRIKCAMNMDSCYRREETFLSVQTDRTGQTVQNQIRLLLEKQADLSLHCLHLIFFIFFNYQSLNLFLLNFRGVPKFRKFTV